MPMPMLRAVRLPAGVARWAWIPAALALLALGTAQAQPTGADEPAEPPVADPPAPFLAPPPAAARELPPAATQSPPAEVAPPPVVAIEPPASAPQPAAPAVAGRAAAPAIAPAPAVAAPASPEPLHLGHARVLDTARLAAGDREVSLFGIVGLTGESAQGLQGFLDAAGGELNCQAESAGEYVCLLPDGTDIAEVGLVNGAARAKPDAPPGYLQQEATAQADRRGIWSSLPPPPTVLTGPRVRDTATLIAEGKLYTLDGLRGLGQPYAGQLQSYIAANGGSLSCQQQAVPGHFICLLPDGTDIAKVALVNGAARVADDAPDSYRVQQRDALDNHRGFWLHPPADAVQAVAVAPPPPPAYAFVPGDDGDDGVSYVGGAPTALIDGETVFLTFAGVAAGWGYYDRWHRWRRAPDRYWNHMERFHPGGNGLRGYQPAFAHPGFGGRPAFAAPPPRPGFAGHPGFHGGGPAPAAAHPGFGGGSHPGASARSGFHQAPQRVAPAPAAHPAPPPTPGGGGHRR